MTYKELMEELDKKGNLDQQNEYIIHCQDIVNAEEFNTNLGNFNIQDDELIELIFNLSNKLTYNYSDCEAYNFDTISYALMSYADEEEIEHSKNFFTRLIEKGLTEDDQNKIWCMIERYNDLDGSYNDGRV